MRIKQKTSLKFVDLEPPTKADFATNVVDEMTDNAATFPAPNPALSVLTTDAANVREFWNSSRNGDRDELAKLDEAVVKINNDLRSQAAYVDSIAKGDEVKINEAGFVATKGETTPGQPPAQSTTFLGSNGATRGKVILSTEILEFADTYTFVIGKNISGVTFNGNIMIVNSVQDVLIQVGKKKKVIFTNLASNTIYQCMVFGTNSKAGKGENSEVLTVTTF